MALTVDKTHYRNPSGLHNKVNWILVESEYNFYKIDELKKRTLVYNASWENAFDIARLIVDRQFNILRERYPQYLRWCREYVNSLRIIR